MWFRMSYGGFKSFAFHVILSDLVWFHVVPYDSCNQGFIQALLLTPVLEKKIQFLWRTNEALVV
jgi:N6-adenosine-specific RNA methylase IME4